MRRTIAFVLMLFVIAFLPTTVFADTCLVDTAIVSDTDTQVSGGDAEATFTHAAWTAAIPGATWIWESFHVVDPTVETVLTFEREFEVSSPLSAALHVASDNSHRAWVNGELVGEDASSDNFKITTQDEYDISTYLVEGTNTLEIEVTNDAGPADPEANPAGLLYRVELRESFCPETPDHGTINAVHYDSDSTYHPDSLRVWGEAVEGATSVRVQLRRTDRSVVDTEVSGIITLGDNDNSYQVFFSPISGYDPEIYQVIVLFRNDSGTMPGFALGTMFTDLYVLDLQEQIDDLEERLDDVDVNLTEVWNELAEIVLDIAALQEDAEELFERVEALEEDLEELEDRVADLELRLDTLGDFGTFHDQVEETLEIHGSGAPEGANWARIVVRTIDNNRVDRTHVEVDEDGTFGHTFDVSEWPIEGMNIYVQFYEDREEFCFWWFGWHCGPYHYIGLLDTVYDTWYGLLGELDYGFAHVEDKTWTGYYVTGPLTRPLAYVVKPHQDDIAEHFFSGGLYRIELVQESSNNEEDISQVLEHCTFLNADDRNFLTSDVEVPAVGRYDARLRAVRTPFCLFDEDEEFESNVFPILMHDLKDDLPDSTLVVTSPESNDEENDIFWTRSDESFGLSASIYLEGADPDTTGLGSCNVEYRHGSSFFDAGQNPIMEADEDIFTCGDDFTVATMRAVEVHLAESEEPYTVQVEVDAEPVLDPADSFLLGVDDTDPVVNEIFPAEEDAVAGTILFTTDVSDSTSGVAAVEVILSYKENDTVVYSSDELVYNETSELWQILVPTEEIPDGAYNITVNVWDFAGNMATLTIDPVVDNTDPVIVEILTPESFLLGLENVVEVTATDNLAGITTVEVELIPYTCDDEQGEGEESEEESEEESQLCSASTECEDSEQIDAEVSIELVQLSLVPGSCTDVSTNTGYCRNGLWAGDLQTVIEDFFDANGLDLDSGLWFEISVTATDAAGNTHTVSSLDEEPDAGAGPTDLYTGFILDITSATDPTPAGQTIVVTGTLVNAFEPEADLSGELVLVGGVEVPVVGGMGWASGVKAVNNVGPQTIGASYTSTCGPVINDQVTVQVIAPVSRGGGGGGGGGNFFEPLSEEDEETGGTSQGDEQPEEETGGEGQQQQNTGDNGEQQQQEPESEPEPEPEPNQITGAVTGGGFGNWGWAGVALLLLAILFVAYFLMKKR